MRRACASVVVGLFLLACGGDSNDIIDARPPSDGPTQPADAAPEDGSTSGLPEDPPTPLPTGDPEVTVLSYNTGLAATVWYAPERKPLIVDKLKALAGEVDVICLQEVWDSYAPNQTSGPKELAGLLAPEWPYAFWDYTKQFLWGNGVLIVSQHPLYRGRSIRFEANDTKGFCDRIVLGVDVLVEGSSYFHVMCTHLQAYNDEENIAVREAEIAEVRAWAQLQGYFDGPTLFLGDMNTGPNTTPCTGELCNPDDSTSYPRLLEDWNDPNEADGGVPNIAGQCTMCQALSRPMQRLDDCASPEPLACNSDTRIDHCLYRGIGESALTESTTALDDLVEITPAEGPDWEACDGGVPCVETCGGSNPCEPRDTQLSDHKAVRCSFAPPG